MRYQALNDFYRKSESQLYLTPVQLSAMSNNQLLAEIANGLLIYQQHLAKESTAFKVTKLVIIAVMVALSAGAASSASAGGATASGAGAGAGTGATAGAAASPGITAAGTAANAGGITSLTVSAPTAATASTVPATSAGIFTKIQSVAKYVSAAGKVYGSATGKDTSKLSTAADIVSSPSSFDAIKTGANYALKQEGLEVSKNNVNAQNAYDELIRREQVRYADNLRKLEAEKTVREIESLSPNKFNVKDVLALATPFILFFMSR